ncbi:unnamed protein product [Camellia sinensis]
MIPEELRVPFERFGVVRDVYIPKNYYTGGSGVRETEPRDFAFVQFVDAYDAAEARCHMNRQIFSGREISVVVAAETKKRLEDMRRRTRVRDDLGLIQYHVLLLLVTILVLEVVIVQGEQACILLMQGLILLRQNVELTTLSPQVQGMQNTHDHQENPQKSDIVTAVAGHILQGSRFWGRESFL